MQLNQVAKSFHSLVQLQILSEPNIVAQNLEWTQNGRWTGVLCHAKKVTKREKAIEFNKK